MNDLRLPGLARATDDAAMHAILARTLEPRRNALGTVRLSVLKHTPGRHCVIEYRLEHGSGEERLIGKLYREPRGPIRFEQLRQVFACSGVNGDGWQPLGVPEPLAYVAELGMVLQRAVPGTELSRLDGGTDWPAAMRAVADNLARLHELPVPAESRRMHDHVRRLCRPSPQELVAARPDLADPVENILQAISIVDREPVARECLVHGDLGMGQVLLADGRAYFVDLDGLCRSDPALDVANFLVSLRLKLGSGSSEAERAFTERYLERRPLEPLAHLDPYQALAYLRRALAGFRPGASAFARDRGERLLAIGNWIARSAVDSLPRAGRVR